MELYRIAPERYLENYSGHGGSFENGGRWTSAGHPVLYMALVTSNETLYNERMFR